MGEIGIEGGGAPQNLSVLVTAEPADGDMSQGAAFTSVGDVNGDGSFALQGLPAGRFLIRARAPSLVVKSIKLGGRDVTHEPLTVGDGIDIHDVVVTLSPQTATLSGAVRRAYGHPSTAEVVVVFPMAPSRWQNYGPSAALFKSAPVGANGMFRIVDLPAGDYLAIVLDRLAANRWKDPAAIKQWAAAAQRVTLKWGSESTVHLEAR